MPEPGKRMGKSGYKMLDVMLNKEGIAKRVGKKITGFDHNGIYIENDTFIESDLTMFIPASAGPAILQQSDLPLSDAGFVKTDDHSKVEGFDNIYAVGDVAAMNGPEWKAKQGHMAVVMGKNAAYNIDRAIKGGTKRKGYQKHINILCVMDTGNGAGFIYRKGPKDVFIPLPIVGHWMKKVWGWHYKLTRTLGI
jgi:sulfide:quinone oxidoreductase